MISYVDNTGTALPTGYTRPFTIPKFSESYARLDRVDYLVSATVVGRASIRNNTPNTISPSVNARTTATFTGIQPFGINVFPSGFQSTVIPRNGSGSLSATGSNEATGTLPVADHARFQGSGSNTFTVRVETGSLTISARGGTVTSSSLSSFSGIRFDYFYTPIGLSQSDPILGPSNNTLLNVPSNRWLQSGNLGNGVTFRGVGGNDKIAALLLPTDLYSEFVVFSNDTYFGTFAQGTQVNIGEAGSVSLMGFGSLGLPNQSISAKLGFANGSSSVTMSSFVTAVPEPSTFLLIGLIVPIGFLSRKLRKTPRFC